MKALSTTLAAAAALATAAPAAAQYYPTPEYQRNLADYEARRVEYERARADYENRLARYESDRARYDARYGYGAYARRYGPAPVWDDAYWGGSYRDAGWSSRDDFERRRAQYERDRANYDARYGYGAYERRYGPPPVWSATDYGVDTAYTGTYADPCRGRRDTNSLAGGLLGALAGAALGSNVAARNARTEGAVLGALVGGAVGVGIGRSTAKCDDRGYYFSYDQTVPYRESAYDRARRSGQYDYSYYARQRCRLAPAPIDDHGRDYRYVRVCPDSDGRYRITG
ncbi:MAG: hypothetical protein ACK41C_09045 [Phenylobacterium sp.]|uniref:hypothetical protein n=1 Tax=Phenylobacterium sp. TaxID=1871053 RepID=UPI00391DE520